MTELEALCQRLEKAARPDGAQDMLDAAHKLRELSRELEVLRARAEISVAMTYPKWIPLWPKTTPSPSLSASALPQPLLFSGALE